MHEGELPKRYTVLRQVLEESEIIPWSPSIIIATFIADS